MGGWNRWNEISRGGIQLSPLELTLQAFRIQVANCRPKGLAIFRAKGRRVQNGQECMENEVTFAMKEGILNVYVKLVT